jgi:integrase
MHNPKHSDGDTHHIRGLRTQDLGLSLSRKRSARPVCSTTTRGHPHTASADTRRCYAQRHTDAGTPTDVLRELMGHKNLGTTETYYRVSEKRTRQAAGHE